MYTFIWFTYIFIWFIIVFKWFMRYLKILTLVLAFCLNFILCKSIYLFSIVMSHKILRQFKIQIHLPSSKYTSMEGQSKISSYNSPLNSIQETIHRRTFNLNLHFLSMYLNVSTQMMGLEKSSGTWVAGEKVLHFS